MDKEAALGKEAGQGQSPSHRQSQGQLTTSLMPRHGRRAVIVVLLMSLGAVGLGLLYLATHPRRAPLQS